MTDSRESLIALRLLGSPAILIDGKPVAGLPRKSEGLLYLLAISGRRWARNELADLLWDDGGSAGRQNLRVALTKLPKALDSVLDRRDDSLSTPSLATDLPYWRQRCQSVQLRLKNCSDPHGIDGLNEDCLALAGWPGLLLEGFELSAPQFGDWLYAERQLLQREWEDAVLAAVATLASKGHWDGAEAALQRLLQLNAGHETAHRWLMQCFMATGRPEAARSQFELCKRQLATLLGVAPTEATSAVLRTGSTATSMRSTAEKPLAPRQDDRLPPAWLLGRETEFAELLELLAQEDIRLVTVVGAGGMGKTCIARALCATRALDREAHFIDLADLTHPDQLAVTLATRLGLELGDGTPAEDRLQHYLIDRQLLLVLDNMEQLLGEDPSRDARAFVRRLIDTCPALQLLVTSREPLHLRDEWLFDLIGLSVADAVRLFVVRAKQVRHDFSLLDREEHVEQICRFVEGMPLAVELAAAATRSAGCKAVLKQLLDGNSPTVRTVDRPSRQRSLDQLIDWSWQLLSPPLQETLAAVSVLEGAWSAHDGCAVSGASLEYLNSLNEKSLLMLEPSRTDSVGPRFRLHPVMRQFAAAQLKVRPDLERQTGRRCSSHYASELRRLCVAFYEGEESQITPRLMEIGANARMTLERFLDFGYADWDELALTQLMAASSQWLPFTALTQWADQLSARFAVIAASLNVSTSRQHADRLDAMRARLGVVHCEALAMLGDYKGARALASEVISRHPARHEALSECFGLRGLCASAEQADEARADLLAAVVHAKNSPNAYFVGQARLWLLRVLMHRFSLTEAERTLTELRTSLNGHRDLSQTLAFFEAEWHFLNGRYGKLAETLEPVVPAFTDDVRDKAQALALLAIGLAERGEAALAASRLAEAENLLQENRDSWQPLVILFYRGVMHWRLMLQVDDSSSVQQRNLALEIWQRAFAAAEGHEYRMTRAVIGLHLAETLPTAERAPLYRQLLEHSHHYRIRHALPWALLGCVLHDIECGSVPSLSLLDAVATYGKAELVGPAQRLYDAVRAALPGAFSAEPAHTPVSCDAAWARLAVIIGSWLEQQRGSIATMPDRR